MNVLLRAHRSRAGPCLSQINGCRQDFSERTGDNADKSAVPRKIFHAMGRLLEKQKMSGRPEKRPEWTGLAERTETVDWHSSCTENV
jgi:hypothetical protein